MSIAFILYGNSSAGKGEVAEKIQHVAAKEHGITMGVAETGKYFRAHPELCHQAHKGELVENHIVMGFFRQKIAEFEKGPAAFDSPRTDGQVALLVEMLVESGYTHIYAVYVDTSEKNCRKRMRERASKQHRLDDKDLRAIENRLSTFRQNWPFVVFALQKYVSKRYFHVNGDKPLREMQIEATVIAREAFGEPKAHSTHKASRRH